MRQKVLSKKRILFYMDGRTVLVNQLESVQWFDEMWSQILSLTPFCCI